MSEVADVNDTILKSNAAAPLLTALKDPQVGRYFKSLSVSVVLLWPPSIIKGVKQLLNLLQITDQPSTRPINGPIDAQKKERHLILSLKVPSSSRVADTIPLVKAVFGLIDFIEGPKFTLRPEVWFSLISYPCRYLSSSSILYRPSENSRRPEMTWTRSS